MPHRTADHGLTGLPLRSGGLYDSKTGQKREGLQGHSEIDFLTKKTSKWTSKRMFLMSCQKFKNICKTFLHEEVN